MASNGISKSLIASARSVLCEASGDKEDYQKFFQKALDKYGVKSPSELDDEKKKSFFDYIDKNWKGDSEDKKESTDIDESSTIFEGDFKKSGKSGIEDLGGGWELVWMFNNSGNEIYGSVSKNGKLEKSATGWYRTAKVVDAVKLAKSLVGISESVEITEKKTITNVDAGGVEATMKKYKVKWDGWDESDPDKIVYTFKGKPVATYDFTDLFIEEATEPTLILPEAKSTEDTYRTMDTLKILKASGMSQEEILKIINSLKLKNFSVSKKDFAQLDKNESVEETELDEKKMSASAKRDAAIYRKKNKLKLKKYAAKRNKKLKAGTLKVNKAKSRQIKKARAKSGISDDVNVGIEEAVVKTQYDSQYNDLIKKISQLPWSEKAKKTKQSAMTYIDFVMNGWAFTLEFWMPDSKWGTWWNYQGLLITSPSYKMSEMFKKTGAEMSALPHNAKPDDKLQKANIKELEDTYNWLKKNASGMTEDVSEDEYFTAYDEEVFADEIKMIDALIENGMDPDIAIDVVMNDMEESQIDEASLMNRVPKGLSDIGKEYTIKKGTLGFIFTTQRQNIPKFKTNRELQLKSLGAEERGSGEFAHKLIYFIIPDVFSHTGKDELVAFRDDAI